LAHQVARLLEVLPDLTGRFEIVLVDDASSDQTLDVARDLAAQYPQVRLVRHRDRLGIAAAVRTGLQWARGSTLFVQDDPAAVSPRCLRRLWRERDRQDLIVAEDRLPHVFDRQLLSRLAAWGESLHIDQAASRPGGLHMIRRGALGRLLADESADEAATILTEPIASSRADESHPLSAPRQAASFLRHLTHLALGE
jgi:glycosyltransferase involved in cell wall biosynthesis